MLWVSANTEAHSFQTWEPHQGCREGSPQIEVFAGAHQLPFGGQTAEKILDELRQISYLDPFHDETPAREALIAIETRAESALAGGHSGPWSSEYVLQIVGEIRLAARAALDEIPAPADGEPA